MKTTANGTTIERAADFAQTGTYIVTLASGAIFKIFRDREGLKLWYVEGETRSSDFTMAEIVARLEREHGGLRANLTEKETAVLEAVRDAEHRDGDPDLSRPVWSTNLTAKGVSTRGMGGVFASLSRKGLVVLWGEGKDRTVALTPAGIKALGAIAPMGVEVEASQRVAESAADSAADVEAHGMGSDGGDTSLAPPEPTGRGTSLKSLPKAQTMADVLAYFRAGLEGLQGLEGLTRGDVDLVGEDKGTLRLHRHKVKGGKRGAPSMLERVVDGVREYDPAKVATVRKVKDLYATGQYTHRSLAERLNADGIPSTNGGKWWVSTVQSALRIELPETAAEERTAVEKKAADHRNILDHL